VRIEEFSIGEVRSEYILDVSNNIPEFIEPYGIDEYFLRLGKKNHLILLAFDGKQAIGFKVGYDRDGDGSFYSWMGGVIPSFRGRNIARALANHQHTWALKQGYGCIRMKTRNKCKGMLIFALSDGFRIIGFEEKTHSDESRIMLEKIL